VISREGILHRKRLEVMGRVERHILGVVFVPMKEVGATLAVAQNIQHKT